MAWLIGDGFDFYGNAHTIDQSPGSIWAPGATSNFVRGDASRFGTGQGLFVGNTGFTSTNPFTNSTTIYLNSAIMCSNATSGGGTNQWFGIWLRESGNIQCAILFRNGGDIVVTSNGMPGSSNGTVIATSPAGMWASNVWAHYQFKVVISNIVGSIECRINGSLTNNWTATGLNTRNGTSNNYCNGLTLWAPPGAIDSRWDDFYCFNDQGVAPNTWQGDVRAVQIMPNSDTGVQDWTPDSGTTHYIKVNEAQDDGDTTYVKDAGGGSPIHQDLYTCGSLASTPAFINMVQGYMKARMDDAGPHWLALRVNSSGNTQDSSTLICTTSYQIQRMLLPVDPHTSAAWTAAGVNALQLGPRSLL